MGRLRLVRELLAELGCARMTLHRWGRGRCQPGAEDVARLARFAERHIGCESACVVGWLCGRDDPRVDAATAVSLSPLAELRQRLGLTRADAARRLGISRSTLAYRERRDKYRSWGETEYPRIAQK